MKQLKIEAGKFYKTRDGRVVEVFCVDYAGKAKRYNNPVVGRVFSKLGEDIRSWRVGGNMEDGVENDLDLVSEWEEPVYRPYNWEEAQGLIGKKVKVSERELHVMIIGVSVIGEDVDFLAGEMWTTAKGLLENYTHLDGSPCGVKEG